MQNWFKTHFIWAIFLFAFVFRIFFGASINFKEEHTRYLQDYTQIYLIGLKTYANQAWPYWGPDISYTYSQIPGALQGILTGGPFYIFKSPLAPFVLLGLLSTLAFGFFAWYLSRRFPLIPKWFTYCWVLFAPWTLIYSTTTINPSYVVSFSVLFFIGLTEILPIYDNKIIKPWVSWFLVGLAPALILQLHMSWVLLPVFASIACFILLAQKKFKVLFTGILFALLGFGVGLSTLIPTIVKYGTTAMHGAGSTVVFNPDNLFAIFGLFFRVLGFATFESRYFMGGPPEQVEFLKDFVWFSPFIIVLFIIGTLHTVFLIAYLFFKSERKEYNLVRWYMIGVIVLLYLSFLFAIRGIATLAFYILVPVPLFYSFYAWEYLFKFKLARKLAPFFIACGVIYHALLAIEMSEKCSVKLYWDKIDMALQTKDTRYFSMRRVANWQRVSMKKDWEYTRTDSSQTYMFDYEVDNAIVRPDEFYTEQAYSGKYASRLDSLVLSCVGFDGEIHGYPKSDSVEVSFKMYVKDTGTSYLVAQLWEIEDDSTDFNDTILLPNQPVQQWFTQSYCWSLNETPADFAIDFSVAVDTASTGKMYVDNFEVTFY
ncbi:MAG: hypothetical protein MI922_03585 [Bacteroidales bacterium]|nr:hypothetical protein [Bacteroidales bacterium]